MAFEALRIKHSCSGCQLKSELQVPTETVAQSFFQDLLIKTQNFGHVTWMGNPIWQNVLDLWTIQEVLVSLKPQLLIECGTNRGGSALFYAHLFDLMGTGEIVTVDVESMHSITHPRISFLIGSSLSEQIVEQVRERSASCDGAVMVILDSDHSESHVRQEMELYSPFVTVGSYLLVQDGVIDELPMMRPSRPGPLPAIHDFLKSHPEFQCEAERSQRFLITHHPMGWLRRVS